MRVVDAANPRAFPFDVPSGLAAILIKQKLVVEWHPEIPNKLSPHELVWEVKRAQNGEPYIYGNCNACVGVNDKGEKLFCNPRISYVGRNPQACIARHNGQTVVPPPGSVNSI